MNWMLNIVFLVVIAVVCFIAGMTVELFINSGELKATRDELLFTKAKLADAQKIIDGDLEVIEIEDKIIKSTPKSDYFKPW
ncbi:MAG: hypothetical protein J5725_05735 [Bacteroidales bacterium]|nr:hypothetical protein [Bacteroidales bacterium]